MKGLKIRTALASFGMSGRIFHAPFLDHLSDFDFKVVLERTKSLSKEKYPFVEIVRSFDEICNHEEIDLIVVNTPSHLHYEMTKQALNAGKHVVVEKPFTATVKEGQELIDLAKSKNLILTVYHNKRLENDVKTIQSIIHSKAIGDLQEITVQLRRYRPEPGPKKWKEDDYPAAGLLYDIGSHFIDQFLYLFGQPERIEPYLKTQRKNGKVNDFFDITFHYKNVRARMISDLLTKDSNFPNIELKGSKGNYVKYSHDPQEARLGSGKWNWETLGIEEKSNHGRITIDGKESIWPSEDGNYISFYENLADVLLKRKEQLLVEPEEALAVIEVIEKVTN